MQYSVMLEEEHGLLGEIFDIESPFGGDKGLAIGFLACFEHIKLNFGCNRRVGEVCDGGDECIAVVEGGNQRWNGVVGLSLVEVEVCLAVTGKDYNSMAICRQLFHQIFGEVACSCDSDLHIGVYLRSEIEA